MNMILKKEEKRNIYNSSYFLKELTTMHANYYIISFTMGQLFFLGEKSRTNQSTKKLSGIG